MYALQWNSELFFLISFTLFSIVIHLSSDKEQNYFPRAIGMQIKITE
jgi:hypothetical protein